MKIFFIIQIIFFISTPFINNISNFENHSEFNLNLFDNILGTSCLDGSQYGVYYSPGFDSGARNILISFWGGGWCAGRDRDSFLDDCHNRSKTSLGSSNFWGRKVVYDGGFLGGNPEKNPNFYNWHRFDFPYCDGTGHQGYVTNPVDFNGDKLFFRGHTNVLTGLQHVISIIDVENIDKVAITGCSAGGLATLYWSQFFSQAFRGIKSTIKVYGFPDSGFFLDHLNINTNDNDYSLKQKILYELVNIEKSPISSECMHDHPSEGYKCLLAEKLFKYIKVPVLMIQPGYDSWQLYNILGETCIANGLNYCDEKLKTLAHEYKNYQNQIISKVLRSKNNISVWGPACVIHCFGEDQQNAENWQVPQDSGNTINRSIKLFLDTDGQQINFIDNVDWPKNEKCAN